MSSRARCCCAWSPKWSTAERRSILLQSFSAVGGPRAWAETVADNVKPAKTKPGAPLKAEVTEQAAQLLVDHDIDTVEDLVAAVEANLLDNSIHAAWRRLPSQSSGVTYSYRLLLAGLPSVKPDRMVVRSLQQALGTDAELTTGRAIALVMAAADTLEVSRGPWTTSSGGRRQIEN